MRIPFQCLDIQNIKDVEIHWLVILSAKSQKISYTPFNSQLYILLNIQAKISHFSISIASFSLHISFSSEIYNFQHTQNVIWYLFYLIIRMHSSYSHLNLCQWCISHLCLSCENLFRDYSEDARDEYLKTHTKTHKRHD